MVTATRPSRTVPPLLKPTVAMPCRPSQKLIRSKIPTAGIPSSLAISTAPVVWSEWPWVTRMWVAPSIASRRRAGSNIGLPSSQGSTSSTWSSISMRKPAWPSQVIFILSSFAGPDPPTDTANRR